MPVGGGKEKEKKKEAGNAQTNCLSLEGAGLLEGVVKGQNQYLNV